MSGIALRVFLEIASSIRAALLITIDAAGLPELVAWRPPNRPTTTKKITTVFKKRDNFDLCSSLEVLNLVEFGLLYKADRVILNNAAARPGL